MLVLFVSNLGSVLVYAVGSRQLPKDNTGIDLGFCSS